MDEELRKIIKHLRLWGLLARWEELLAEANRGRFSLERLLDYVLREEWRVKSENARLLRRKRANIPELLEIETFPFARQPKLDRKRIMSLYDSGSYLTKQRNIVWMGPTGCGKTGLATGFLLNAIDRGHRGYFISFAELVAELFAALADRSERKVLGYFWIGDQQSQVLVLCESAIDAISCFQLRGACICISTAGVRANPGWLPGLIARGYAIYCGFDTDKAGEAAAAKMMALYPLVQRLRPPAHDWNDALATRS